MTSKIRADVKSPGAQRQSRPEFTCKSLHSLVHLPNEVQTWLFVRTAVLRWMDGFARSVELRLGPTREGLQVYPHPRRQPPGRLRRGCRITSPPPSAICRL